MLTLDVGSSSVRTLLFGLDGRQIDGVGSQISYQAKTTPDGGWEIDAGQLTGIAARAIGETCGQIRAKNLTAAAVAVDTFWHTILGVDADGNPINRPASSFRYAQRERLETSCSTRRQHGATQAYGLRNPSELSARETTLAFRNAARCLSPDKTLDERRRVPVPEISG